MNGVWFKIQYPNTRSWATRPSFTWTRRRRKTFSTTPSCSIFSGRRNWRTSCSMTRVRTPGAVSHRQLFQRSNLTVHQAPPTTSSPAPTHPFHPLQIALCHAALLCLCGF